MEVVIIVVIAVLCVAAIVGGIIIYFTKGPPETPSFRLVNYRDPPMISRSRTETDPLLFVMEVPSHTPPSFSTKPATQRSNVDPDIYMRDDTGIYKLSPLRKNARKRRSSSRASRRR